jgi:hypothetical protein
MTSAAHARSQVEFRFWPIADNTRAKLIPALAASHTLVSSRPHKEVDLDASCIEGGLQVGYSHRHARRDYPRLAAPLAEPQAALIPRQLDSRASMP